MIATFGLIMKAELHVNVERDIYFLFGQPSKLDRVDSFFGEAEIICIVIVPEVGPCYS